MYVYRNIIREDKIEKLQGIGGGLVLLYYIKKSIDGMYAKKEQKLSEYNK